MANRTKKLEPVTGPVRAQGVFKHYVARPFNATGHKGRINYRYFDDVCQAAVEKAEIMLCTIHVIAVNSDGSEQLARRIQGGLPR